MFTMASKSSPLHVHCSKGYTVIKFSSFSFFHCFSSRVSLKEQFFS